jgi:hypothetical protein
MKRIIIAAVLAVVLPVGLASAAGPFDGKYTGGAARVNIVRGAGCPAITATITVADSKMTGSYSDGTHTFPVNAAVAADGTVTGKWSVYPLTGKFAGTHFDGSYTSHECNNTVRGIALDKSG